MVRPSIGTTGSGAGYAGTRATTSLPGGFEGRVTVVEGLGLRLSVGYVTTAKSSARDPVVVGVLGAEQPLFPEWQAHFIGEYQLPWLESYDIRIIPEVSYVGPRDASASNSLELGRANEMDPYVHRAIAVSSHEEFESSLDVSLAIRLTNVLDQHHAEPGFGGIDVPSLGRTLLVTLTLAHPLF